MAGLAEVSYRWVERPIRNGALGQVWHGWRSGHGPVRRALALRGVALAGGLIGYTALVAPAVAAAKAPEAPSYVTVAASDTVQAHTVLGQPAATPASEDTAAAPAAPDASAVVAPGSPQAAPTPTVASPQPVMAVGDSVMLGAAPALQRTFDQIQVDAAVGRQVQAGLQVLRAKRAADVPRVVFVNLRVPRSWEAPNNAVIAAAVQRSSNAVLVDGHAASSEAAAHVHDADAQPDVLWRPRSSSRNAGRLRSAKRRGHEEQGLRHLGQWLCQLGAQRLGRAGSPGVGW